MQDIHVMQVLSLGQEDPLEEEMASHSRILSWEIYGQRWAWQATAPGITDTQTQLRTNMNIYLHQKVVL